LRGEGALPGGGIRRKVKWRAKEPQAKEKKYTEIQKGKPFSSAPGNEYKGERGTKASDSGGWPIPPMEGGEKVGKKIIVFREEVMVGLGLKDMPTGKRGGVTPREDDHLVMKISYGRADLGRNRDGRDKKQEKKRRLSEIKN